MRLLLLQTRIYCVRVLFHPIVQEIAKDTAGPVPIHTAEAKCVRCRKTFVQIVQTAKHRDTLAGICSDCRHQPPARFRIASR